MRTAHETGVGKPVQEVTIDADARAAYIRLHRAGVARTKPWNDDESVILDLDAEGRLIGIEVLGLTTDIPIDQLAQSYHFPESLVQTLKEIQQTLWGVEVTRTAGTGDVLVPSNYVL